MEEVDSSLRHLARQLLAYESGGAESVPELSAAADRAWRKLHLRLANLIGHAGFNAIAERALKEVRAEFPLLEGVEPEARESFHLRGLEEIEEGVDSAGVGAANAAVLARFLWLLGTLIGLPLTMDLVRRIWPDFPLDEAGPGAEETGR